MNNPKNPKLGHNKKTFLEKPVEHIDITSFDSRKIIDSMDKMSFTSRDTAKASSIFNEMLSDKNCTTFLTLAAALPVPLFPVLIILPALLDKRAALFTFPLTVVLETFFLSLLSLRLALFVILGILNIVCIFTKINNLIE